jgi:uncharacterized protein
MNVHRVVPTAGSIRLVALVVLASCASRVAFAQAPAVGYALKPVSFERVAMTDDFWRPRLETQRRVLLPFAFQQTETALGDIRAAAQKLAGREPNPLPPPHRYRTSDLFKVMEGAAYLLAVEPDAELERQLDEIIGTVAAAQAPDGFFNATRTLYPQLAIDMMGDRAYSYVDHSHELYIVGHMYEAAVAYFRATGKRTFLDVAERNAQHIQRVFFEGDPRYNDGKPVNQADGHEEIELALVKLADATGKREYLDLAQRFLDIRGVTHRPTGEGVFAATYAQEHAPVAEQTKPVGHAVRATYLYSGMADVGAMQGSDRYTAALESIWNNIVDTRMHITGGLGAVHGIEGFGPEFELPNADAFDETCAAVGNVLLNWRMFLLHGDAKYVDVAELALYNNVLAGVNFAGDRFFYVNPLAADGERKFNHGHAGRAPWFDTACCPTNLARLIPQAPGMLYAQDDKGVLLCLYAGSRTTLDVGGTPVAIEQETTYPNSGRVRVTLRPATPVKFALRLRIPTWTGKQLTPGALYRYDDGAGAVKGNAWRLSVNGKPLTPEVEKGFVTLQRTWAAGDVLELVLPMPVRINVCREEVEANRLRAALSRGPLVYCVEEVDNKAPADELALRSDGALGEVDVEPLEIARREVMAVTVDGEGVHGEDRQPARVKLVPYFAWNNRGDGSMAVWLPRGK